MTVSGSVQGHVYDVMIVGGGIAGCEAALGCNAAGLDTLLVTTSLDTVYSLLGDGVKVEPHAGTFMAEVFPDLSDNTGMVANWAMHSAAKQRIEVAPRIHFLQSSISGLIVENGQVIGVDTWEGVARFARCTALCVGSFLKSRLTVGTLTETAGRLSEMSYDDLYENLVALGFQFEALKLEAEFDDESLPYTVDCQVFAVAERDVDTYRLPRLANLYAAGVCFSGFVSYENAALEGRRLAATLVTDL